MKDLHPITDEILQNALKKAAEINRQSDKDISDRSAAFEKELLEKRAEFEKNLSEEIARRREISKVQKRQIFKAAETKAKSDFAKSVCAAAKTRLASLSGADYSELMAKFFRNAKIPPESTVYLNERDKGRVKKEIFKGAEISTEAIGAEGGFIAVFGKITYNCTLESIFEEKYDEICAKIHALCREVQT